MKKYIKKAFGALALSVVLLSGCTDLTYENYTYIDSESFPQSAEDLYASLIGVYNVLGSTFVQVWLNNAGLTAQELPTDELNTGWTSNPWIIYDTYLWTANNNPISGLYSNYQKGITKATKIIVAVENSDNLTEKTKAQYIAELKALRVFFMQQIYSLVGPMPVVRDPAVATDVYTEWKPSRPSRAEYVSWMEEDILSSYQDLAVSVDNQNWGRMTRGASLALLMKIYLNEKRWDDVIDIANRIIALNQYSLMPTYKALFDIANEGPQNTEEMFIVGRVVSNTSFAWSWFTVVLPNYPMYKGQVSEITGISGGLKVPWSFYDKYEPNDGRLCNLIRYYYDTDGNYVDFRQVVHAKQTGANPMKYSEDPDQVGGYQGSDAVILRYADVLLSKAEALNQKNGPTAECIELINQIRRRAGATEIKLGDFTKESLNDFLLDERGREFYCEGLRRDDLIRHGKFVSSVAEQGLHPEEYHALYPVPQSVINENPNITQNPGY